MSLPRMVPRDINKEAGSVVSETAIYADDPNDPNTYYMGFDWHQRINLTDLLASAPTSALYRLQDALNKEIGKRVDGKR